MVDIKHFTWEDVEELHQNGVFCPEAWVSLSSNTNGNWRMCCYATRFKDTIHDSTPLEHMNIKARKIVRKAMLVNKPEYLSICERCHHAEAQGNDSRRTRMMGDWRKNDEIKANILKVMNTTQPDGTIDPLWFERVDVKFTGNKCNLRCFTCHPGSSSAFAIEAKKMGDVPADYQVIQDPFSEMIPEMKEKFWDEFEVIMDRTHILNFTGGEPFMIDAYWEMIERSVASGAAKTMELHLSSNMTIIKYGKRSVLDYFGEFKKVRLQCSIDGTEEYNAYIRYPSVFSTIMENIKKVQEMHSNVDIVVSSVVSSLNVKNIPALNDYLLERGIKHDFANILHTPTHQRIEWLPKRVKDQYLANEFNRPDAEEKFGDLMALLRKPGNKQFNEWLIARCRSLDKQRGTDFTILWPEFVEYHSNG